MKKNLAIKSTPTIVIHLAAQKRHAKSKQGRKVRFWMQPGDTRRIANDRYLRLLRHNSNNKKEVQLLEYSQMGLNVKQHGYLEKPTSGTDWSVPDTENITFAQVLAIANEGVDPNAVLVEITVYKQESSHVSRIR